ncbi:MAG: Crp/Fnr family transcriptional regulator [Leptolinea sp.]
MLEANQNNLPILLGLDPSQISQIQTILESCMFAENSMVFQQDQEAFFLYILTFGEVIIRFKPYDGEELTIAQIYPEGIFGWSAVLGRPHYTSSAYCSSAATAIRIRADLLQQFCERNPELGMILLDRLASGIALRLKSTHAEVLAMLTRGLIITPER